MHIALPKEKHYKNGGSKAAAKAAGKAAAKSALKKAAIKGGLKMAGGAALRALPGVGVLAGMGLGAFEGWNDAGNIVGKDPDKLTTGDKIEGAAYGAASALTLGLVDPKTIRDGTQAAVGWAAKNFFNDGSSQYEARNEASNKLFTEIKAAGGEAAGSAVRSAIIQGQRLQRKAALRGEESLTGYEKHKIQIAKQMADLR